MTPSLPASSGWGDPPGLWSAPMRRAGGRSGSTAQVLSSEAFSGQLKETF